MNLGELITRFRIDADDTRKPYLFSDEFVTSALNEAEEEAALRADLIFEADDSTICEIPVTAGSRKYDLNDRVFRVTHAAFTPTGSDEACILTLHSRLVADDARRDRRATMDKPRAVIVDDTTLEFDCLPDTDGLLAIECYRAPLEPMKNDKDEPEIGRAHHRLLTKWVEHRAYGRPDTETFDQQRADRAELAFTMQFGIRPDADQRRALQNDQPAHNVGYF